jgi:PKD repeat protein
MRHNATAMTWLQRGLLAVLGTTLVVAGLQATGNAVAKVNVADGTVWLASPPMGTMVQVSASSEQVLATVSVARQGDPLTAAQDGHSALVLNRSTGEVGRVDGATLHYGQQRSFASSSSDLQLLSGKTRAYVLDTGQGVVHSLDLGHLAPAKDTPLGTGPKEAQVDSKGNLWALDTEGQVTLVTAKGDSYTAKVAGKGASLTLADDKPYVVDPGGQTDNGKHENAKVVALDVHNAKADRRYCLDGVDQPGLLTTGTRTNNGRQLVMALVPGASQVVTSDLGNRKCTVLGVSDDMPGADQTHSTSYGKPVAHGDLLFVPVVSRGQVMVIDTAENRIVRTIDKNELFVKFTGQPFELLVDDSNVWFNNLGGPEASVIGRDGVLMRVLKYESSTSGVKGKGNVDAGIAATSDANALQVNVDPGKGTINTERPGTTTDPKATGTQGSGGSGSGKDGKGKGTGAGVNAAQGESQTATLTVIPPGAPSKDAPGSSLSLPDVSITPGDNRVAGPGSAGIAPLPAGSAADLPPAPKLAKLTANFAYSARVVEAGQTVAFQDTSTGSPPPNSWQWDFGDGSPLERSQHVMHVFKTAGTYSMSLSVSNGSASDKTPPFQIEVVGPNQPPSANFTFDPPNPEVGSPVQFTDNSAGIVSDWSWSWGDGTVASGKVASKTFTTPNQYKVTLTVRNQFGSSSATKTVSVVDKVIAPKATFTFSPTKIAVNDPVTFSDTSIGGPTTYRWDFGDGSGDFGNTKQWIHKFAKAGDFNVKLTVSNARGTSEVTQKVTVLATTQPPKAAFTATANTAEVNQKITFTFTPSSAGDNGITPGTPTGYTWDFGDGTPPPRTPAADHAWTLPGTYNVTLTVTNDAGTSTSTPLAVKIDKASTKLVATFSVRPGSTAQDPARPNTPVDFRDLSGPTVTTWEWDFGDGAKGSGAAVTHSYARAGTYTATLKVSDGVQTATTTNRVFVVGATTPPVADFTYGPAKPQVSAPVAFSDRSTGTPTSWKWDFGDGKGQSAEQNPSHIYGSAGTYNVTLTATNAAGQMSPPKTVAVTVTVVALPPPKPDFTVGPAPLNAGKVLTFTDVTPNAPNAVSTPVFTFPTGTVTPQPGTRSAQYTFADAGTFPVTMKSCLVEDPANCAQATQQIQVQAAVDPPQAGYVLSGAIVDQTTGIVDGEVIFTDTSKGSGITSSTWVIGTRTFTGTEVRFTAASPGDVTVSHMVTNAAGSNEVKGVVHFVARQLPTAQFSVGTATAGSPVQFTDQSTGSPTRWRWDFGDGTTSTEQSPAHTFARSGSMTVTLWASNQFGESSPTSRTVVVDPAAPQPKIQITSGQAAAATPTTPITVRQNTAVQLTDAGATADITSWDWNFGDSTAKGTGQNVSHTWSQVGTYSVVLISTNSRSVTGTNTVTIRVI